jgi:hypothetical protein
MAQTRTNSGRRLNEQWGVNARHALYHRRGYWYERLVAFPGALFDENGYVLFATEESFLNCPELQIKKQVWVRNGIANIPGYRRFQADASRRLIEKFSGADDAFEEGAVKYQLHRKKERNQKAVRRKKQRVLAQFGALVCEVCDFDFSKTYGPLGYGFAECHHRVPFSSLAEGHKTKLSELAIVCANCHRMLHKSRPMLSVEQLRQLVQPRESK